MVLQNYQNFIEIISNMIYIVALGGGFKCPFEHIVGVGVGGDHSLRDWQISQHFFNQEGCKLRPAYYPSGFSDIPAGLQLKFEEKNIQMFAE